MLNVGRMLLNFESDSGINDGNSMGVFALLSEDYTYTRLGGDKITLSKGTQIFVDESRMIANHRKDYFSVEEGDYRIQFIN